jgi:hypothetical protein
MTTPKTEQGQHDDEGPPILGSWNRIYAFVLILHAVIIALFYFFTHAYS